jgi:hypothetical protein
MAVDDIARAVLCMAELPLEADMGIGCVTIAELLAVSEHQGNGASARADDRAHGAEGCPAGNRSGTPAI